MVTNRLPLLLMAFYYYFLHLFQLIGVSIIVYAELGSKLLLSI